MTQHFDILIIAQLKNWSLPLGSHLETIRYSFKYHTHQLKEFSLKIDNKTVKGAAIQFFSVLTQKRYVSEKMY